LTYYTHFVWNILVIFMNTYNSLRGRSYFQFDCCSLMFVHNGKRMAFVFCEQMILLLLTPCWIHLCARGSRRVLGITLCAFPLPQSAFVWYVTGRHEGPSVCLSLHHVFPLPSCWIGFREIRYQGFTKHCLRAVSFVHIIPLQYNICRALIVLQIEFLY
jgi:hypothetical protein